MKGSAKNDTIDKSMNAEARHKEDRAENLTNVIHDGCKRGKKKMLIGLQACHHEAADGKDNRTNEVQAHEFCEKLTLFRAKTRCDAKLSVHDWPSKDSNNDSDGASNNKRKICNTREQIPRYRAAARCEIFTHQWDECHRQRAARN